MKVYPGEKICETIWYCGGIDLSTVSYGTLPHTLVFRHKTEAGFQYVFLRTYMPLRKGSSYGKRRIGGITFEILEIHDENYGLLVEIVKPDKLN